MTTKVEPTVEKWVTLESLRPGAIFETKDGVMAVKSEYRYSNDNPDCECVLLESGEYAHFPNHNNELVREVSFTHSVQEAKAEERERILEAIQPAVNDFMAGANVLVEHKMVNSAKEMRENIQYIVCAIRGTHKEYAASLKQEGDKAEECRHELPKGECFICGESI